MTTTEPSVGAPALPGCGEPAERAPSSPPLTPVGGVAPGHGVLSALRYAPVLPERQAGFRSCAPVPQCWADIEPKVIVPNPQPIQCHRPGVGVLGLCPSHAEEILGV